MGHKESLEILHGGHKEALAIDRKKIVRFSMRPRESCEKQRGSLQGARFSLCKNEEIVPVSAGLLHRGRECERGSDGRDRARVPPGRHAHTGRVAHRRGREQLRRAPDDRRGGRLHGEGRHERAVRVHAAHLPDEQLGEADRRARHQHGRRVGVGRQVEVEDVRGEVGRVVRRRERAARVGEHVGDGEGGRGERRRGELDVEGVKGVAITSAMRRMWRLVGRCVSQNEPALLIGETGSGKTTICQLYAAVRGQRIRILNCHQSTETTDIIGGLRPVRGKEATVAQAREDLIHLVDACLELGYADEVMPESGSSSGEKGEEETWRSALVRCRARLEASHKIEDSAKALLSLVGKLSQLFSDLAAHREREEAECGKVEKEKKRKLEKQRKKKAKQGVLDSTSHPTSAMDEDEEVEVVVPEGLLAGEEFEVDCGSFSYTITVPDGVVAGEVITMDDDDDDDDDDGGDDGDGWAGDDHRHGQRGRGHRRGS